MLTSLWQQRTSTCLTGLHRQPVTQPQPCGWPRQQSAGRAQERSLQCQAQPWRPHIDDVDRLSRGDGARHRGTGCRDVPHRLNAEERKVYDSAKKKGYLAVRGTGYRRERKGNPLPNTFRQWCDAKAMACVVIEQDWAGGDRDTVVVDLSTLRMKQEEVREVRGQLLGLAGKLGVTPLPDGARPLEAVPFNILLPPEPAPPRPVVKQPSSKPRAPDAAGAAAEAELQKELDSLAAASPLDRAARVAAAEQRALELQHQADAAAAEVRRLKEEVGWHNAAPVVREAVAVMKQRRAELEQANMLLELAKRPYSARQAALFAAFDEPATEASDTAQAKQTAGVTAPIQPHSTPADASHEEPRESQEGLVLAGSGGDAAAPVDEDDEGHPRMKNAIWSLPAQPVFLTAGRAEAKAFAKEASMSLLCSLLQKTVLASASA